MRSSGVFLWKFVGDTKFTCMGSWWDRKGENEIDLVCEGEIADKLLFCEIRRDGRELKMGNSSICPADYMV